MNEDDEIITSMDGMVFVRRLVYHEDSDSLFEVRTDLEWESCFNNGCDDVTGIEEFETEFREKQINEQKQQDALPILKKH